MMRFFDFLFPPRADELALRGVSADTFLALLAPRLVPCTRPSTTALLPFSDGAVRAAIHEAKYHGSEAAFNLLALSLAEYLLDADETSRTPVIVPVPLGAARRKERGFNQTEEIARRTLRLLGEKHGLRLSLTTEMLTRTRETASQVSLPRHLREENMRGAISAAHPADPAHTYIVLDDVVTTGATLQAASDALRSAGARHIVLLALAH